MPAIVRQGDVHVGHASPTPSPFHQTPYPGGSSNVFVNGIGVSRQGDNNTGHLLPGSPCPGHSAPIATGSTSVFVNGKGCGRVGDGISGCTSVAEGSEDVFAGG